MVNDLTGRDVPSPHTVQKPGRGLEAQPEDSGASRTTTPTVETRVRGPKGVTLRAQDIPDDRALKLLEERLAAGDDLSEEDRKELGRLRAQAAGLDLGFERPVPAAPDAGENRQPDNPTGSGENAFSSPAPDLSTGNLSDDELRNDLERRNLFPENVRVPEQENDGNGDDPNHNG